jgi:hypothetical protein
MWEQGKEPFDVANEGFGIMFGEHQFILMLLGQNLTFLEAPVQIGNVPKSVDQNRSIFARAKPYPRNAQLTVKERY